ncbi:MAG: hypothetical protein Q9226_002529 [Calogaya cf. arnoldii]
MATNIKLCSPRGRAGLTGTRHLRGYCWGTRHHWSYGTYPKSLKSLDSYMRSSSASDNARLCYARTKKPPSSDNYSLAPLSMWRASSSWGRWTWDLDKSVRKLENDINNNRKDAEGWSSIFERLDKDTAELRELIKKRIDADPFDALFGRRLLHPNLAKKNGNINSNNNKTTCWGLGGSDLGSKKKQQPPDTSSKSAKAAGVEVGNKQHADRVSTFPRKIQDILALSGQNRYAGSNSLAEDYDIDFITMRKIPKGSVDQQPEASPPSTPSDQTFDIPVKPFKEAIPEKPSRQLPEEKNALKANVTASQPSDTRSKFSHEANRLSWLSQEGFGSKKECNPSAEPTVSETAASVSPTRIESAIERRMRKSYPGVSADGSHSSLTYDPKENKTDDVDLLRASDIRAASGAARPSRHHDEVQKHENRMKLEADFTALQEMETIGLKWKKELEASKKRIQEAHARNRHKASDAHLEGEILAQKAAMEALEMRRADDGTSSSTVTVAQPERGEGDMASNVHEFVDRDRWYKKKAPHAAMTEERKSEQLANARSLVREIRDIYEDTYGAIDTKHRQPKNEISGVEEQTSNTSPNGNEGSLTEPSGEMKKATKSNGPLSTQEKIGTMLQQLLDDSQYLQKLIRTPELTSQTREELFHRNRSMQNASEAIVEALSPTSPVPDQGSVKDASISKNPTAMNAMQELSQPVLPSTDVKKPSTVYNVLAYDPSIQQVTTAEMVSSGDSSSERRLDLSEALSSLTDPVKFLPQLTRLQSQGFEIVSSDTNILVLKKSYNPRPSKADVEASTGKAERQRSINPIDGTTSHTGHVASPKGFVSAKPEQPARTAEGKEAEPTPSGYKVRREEDVFSGSGGNQWDNRPGVVARLKSRHRRWSRRRRTTKRMLWVGLWTAGCCYAVGAITEFLRA